MLLVSIIVLSVLGMIFGIALSLASKVFHVEIDPKIEQIEEALPGVNCGACGYPGCSGYAKAIVMSGAEPTLCAPGGDVVAAEIAKIMGTKASKKRRNIAVIHAKAVELITQILNSKIKVLPLAKQQSCFLMGKMLVLLAAWGIMTVIMHVFSMRSQSMRIICAL